MSDYIKRSDALNFDLEIECEPDDLQPMMEGMVRVMDYIKKLPTADVVKKEEYDRLLENALIVSSALQKYQKADVVEVVHGKWLRTPTWWVYCSVCGCEPPQETNATTRFCPNCGARMDGGADNATDRR